MASREGPAERGRSRGDRLSYRFAADLRTARRSSGLTQQSVARHARVSQSLVSRLERGIGRASMRELAAIAAVVGLDLVVSLYPGGAPIRDVAHARLLARLQAALPGLRGWRAEVPLPIPGDQRAIDAMVRLGSGRVGFELETRLIDAQETARRAALKQREGGLACMILVLADTRANRAALVAAASTLRAAFPLAPRAVMAALRSGSPPPENGLFLV